VNAACPPAGATPLGDAWAERRVLICVKKDWPANVSLTHLLDALRPTPR